MASNAATSPDVAACTMARSDIASVVSVSTSTGGSITAVSMPLGCSIGPKGLRRAGATRMPRGLRSRLKPLLQLYPRCRLVLPVLLVQAGGDALLLVLQGLRHARTELGQVLPDTGELGLPALTIESEQFGHGLLVKLDPVQIEVRRVGQQPDRGL